MNKESQPTDNFKGLTAFEAGEDFYTRKIKELEKEGPTLSGAYGIITNKEQIEEAQMRLSHLERRKKSGLIK